MRHLTISVFLYVFFLMTFTSCLKDDCSTSRTVFVYDPVYMTEAEINQQTISKEVDFPLQNPGKVFYKGDILFVSEIGQGVHIYDNSDNRNPQPLAFLRIPGNIDVSFKGNYLIADSYLNILIIDISDLENPSIESKIDNIKSDFYYYDEQKDAYIVDYIPSNKTIEVPCNHPFFENEEGYYIHDDFGLWVGDRSVSFESSVFSDGAFFNAQGQSPGIAGSLSSFALVGEYFYFISGPEINIYNIANIKDPIFIHGFDVDWNIETLFPYQDKLFIGGQNGMYIYDNSDPTNPSFLSQFVHARACDPVFVEGNTAYVTLSEGNTCTNFTNQLDVIDISNLLEPALIKSYPMYRPKGLSVYNNTLFICDDKAGMKIFDATDKLAIADHKLSTILGITFIEVIHLSPDVIMGIGPDGIFQYNVADPENPQLLSHISIQ